jgi:hypothetical protein
MKIHLILDDQMTERLVQSSVRELRPVALQAEILLKRALLEPESEGRDPTSGLTVTLTRPEIAALNRLAVIERRQVEEEAAVVLRTTLEAMGLLVLVKEKPEANNVPQPASRC